MFLATLLASDVGLIVLEAVGAATPINMKSLLMNWICHTYATVVAESLVPILRARDGFESSQPTQE